MLDTREALIDKIRLGEDSFLELKEVRFSADKLSGPSQSDLADELAAFANSRGGVLVLGVSDKSRTVIGIAIERLDGVEAVLRQACEQSVRPPLAPIIERMTLPDAAGTELAVLRVELAPSLFVHQSPGGYLHRIGSSKRPIPPDHLARLFQQRSQSRLIRFDETPVATATISDLDPALWRRFAPAPSRDAAETLLHKLGMAAQDDRQVWRPTVAGVLLGTRAPQRFIPSAFVQAVAYRGHSVVPQQATIYQRDARDITGPLDRQIFDACAFVRKNMQVAARKRPDGGRQDVPQFDMLAVFEAVTNALAHRDYSMAGSKVRLRLFDDRLEIYSPGMLPNTMAPESMPFRQAARNETLTSLLARCPVEEDSEAAAHRTSIMDKRGEGVPIILARTLALAGEPATYTMVDDSELLLRIPAARTEESP